MQNYWAIKMHIVEPGRQKTSVYTASSDDPSAEYEGALNAAIDVAKADYPAASSIRPVSIQAVRMSV